METVIIIAVPVAVSLITGAICVYVASYKKIKRKRKFKKENKRIEKYFRSGQYQ